MTVGSFAVVFLALFFADLIWTLYIKAVAASRRAAAALWSGLIVALGATSTLGYMRDPWHVVPAVLGAVAGTYVALVGAEWFRPAQRRRRRLARAVARNNAIDPY